MNGARYRAVAATAAVTLLAVLAFVSLVAAPQGDSGATWLAARAGAEAGTPNPDGELE